MTRKSFRFILVGIVALVVPVLYGAQGVAEAPTTGMVYHTTERSALTYECRRMGPTELTCKFMQSAVRRKLTQADLPEKLAEAEAQVQEWKPEAKECAEIKETLKLFDTEPEKVEKLDPRERDAMLEPMLAMAKTCDTGSKDGLRAAMRKSVERDLKSSRVSSYEFEQSFQLADNVNGEPATWVTKSGEPSGTCGTVQLSRFERDMEVKNTPFWNYISRKAVTNPNGKDIFGKCSELDEGTYSFTWRSDKALSTWADCDQIEFSAF